MKQLFEDKVVWLTGGGSGIGRAVALAFARHGAAVAVSGRRIDRLEEVAGEITALGGRARALACDVCDEEQVSAAASAVVDAFGRLDVTLANAGFSVAGKVEQLSAAEWRRQLDVNVIGTALTARYALPWLRETKGRLGLVGSVMGFMCAPKMAAYSASKYAVRALGQTLAIELAGSGVSCTTVHPGYVASEINQVDNAGHHDPTRVDQRPARLMWPADKAANVIVRALHRRKRELVFTGHGKVGAFIGQHMPSVLHMVMTRGRA
jgi:NAD(P)-dependent dehydrogenase (short-subunit alcohol dehydrogenase family)